MKKARVIEEHKTNYMIRDGEEDFLATVRGTFFEGDVFPKVGDFVLYEEVADGKAVIEEVVARTSVIVRKAAETGDEQVIVANVDLIFIVMGLDDDFNMSRLERYLVLATQSEVKPVVILNKSDSIDDVDAYIEQVKEAAGQAPVHAVSALTGENMESLLEYFDGDITAVLLGSSGAGKSTITNWLLNTSAQETKSVREDDSRGRHTTTHRQLFTLPSGGYLIDTPGMRELGVFTTEEDEAAVFERLDELATACRFTNCDHEKSAGCAILEAVADGEVTERELLSYRKLQRERLFEESKRDESVSKDYRQKQKQLHKYYKEVQKGKKSGRFS